MFTHCDYCCVVCLCLPCMQKMPLSSELTGGNNKVKFSEQLTMATSSGLLPSSGLKTNNLSTSNLDSTSLLNGGKELLGSEHSVARPSLKSRVSGKICIFCGGKAVGPHEAKCGHSGCYSCWLKGMKVTDWCALCCRRTVFLHSQTFGSAPLF